MKKCLVAFDFDHTIIHFNSDIVVQKLIPEDFFTEELKKLKEGPEWIEFMQSIFKILHKANITREQILKSCADCECTEGMLETLKMLKSKLKADIIIISDSNSVFIEHWLRSRCILNLIDKVYTNPAKFTLNGMLEVQMYHDQNWCNLSTRNMCKGHILEKHLELEKKRNKVYDFVAYVGDGRNDLCPVLRLSSNDLCFPRVNYTLYKILTKNEEYKSRVKAAIHPWNRGDEILSVIQKACYSS